MALQSLAATGDPYYCFEHKQMFCNEIHFTLWDKTGIAYLAGFFDGEGNIIIARDKTKLGNVNYRLRISASQVEREPLDKFKAAFGGLVMETVKPNPKHRNIFSWQQHSQLARTALEQLHPYLIIKADQAEFAINFIDENRKFKGKKKSAEDIAWCEEQKAILSKMKGFL